jgi:anti-anti-sigma factor
MTASESADRPWELYEPGDSPLLSVQALGDRRLIVIEASGEVDIGTADLLSECGAWALLRRPLRLAVDLSGITFFSAAGVRALIRMRTAADAEATDFRLRAPSHAVRYVLELASVFEQFRLDGVDGAHTEPEPEREPDAAAAEGTGATQ